ncbi:unnamed protein product [Jaminaea pallidilutea]
MTTSAAFTHAGLSSTRAGLQPSATSSSSDLLPETMPSDVPQDRRNTVSDDAADDSLQFTLPSPNPVMGDETWSWADENEASEETTNARMSARRSMGRLARKGLDQATRLPGLTSLPMSSSSSQQTLPASKTDRDAAQGKDEAAQAVAESYDADAEAEASSAKTASTHCTTATSRSSDRDGTRRPLQQRSPTRIAFPRKPMADAPSSPEESDTDSSMSSDGDDDTPTMMAGGSTSAASSSSSSVPKPSLPSRSYMTLRNMAAAWVPGGSRFTTPLTTPKEGRSPTLTATKDVVPLGKEDEKRLAPLDDEGGRRRPVKLDRRRLDKAVSLAVEAAQAAQEDEKAWRAKERRRKARMAVAAEQAEREAAVAGDYGLLARIRTLSEYSGLAGIDASGQKFKGLPWGQLRKGQSKSIGELRATASSQSAVDEDLMAESNGGRSVGTSDDELRHESASLPHENRGREDGSNSSSTSTSSRKAAVTARQDTASDDDEEEDNFSLSLYLSSLSYLLSALPAKEAGHLPAKQREELTGKLRQMMQDLGVDDETHGSEAFKPTGTTRSAADQDTTAVAAELALGEAQREERLRELLETELRRAEARMLASTKANSANRGRNRSSQLVDGLEQPRTSVEATEAGAGAAQSTMAGTIATATLELTFAVAAAGVGLLGSGLNHWTQSQAASQSQVAQSSEEATHAKIVGELAVNEKALVARKPAGSRSDASKSRQRSRRPPPAAAQKRRDGQRPRPVDLGPAAPRSRGLQWDLAMALASSTASTLYANLSAAAAEAAREGDPAVRTVQELQNHSGELTEEDRLIALSASFARSLKRSPLPSQLSSLSGQLLSLMHSLDERYELRRRATDEALKRTRQGLGYVRRRGWHVAIVRGAWAMMEMGVAGVEAWREEGEDGELDGEAESSGLEGDSDDDDEVTPKKSTTGIYSVSSATTSTPTPRRRPW